MGLGILILDHDEGRIILHFPEVDSWFSPAVFLEQRGHFVGLTDIIIKTFRPQVVVGHELW